VIDELAKLVAIEPKDRKRFKHLLEESKNFASVPIRTRLTDDEVARFTAQRFRFPGVEVQARLFRQYPLGEIASHVLGYIGRINQNEAKVIEAATTPPTTTAPTISARKAWRRATSASCTARPATKKSSARPAAAPSARCRARRRCRAPT
jgi:cell division protein FtsI/penicillin-binding protein 2